MCAINRFSLDFNIPKGVLGILILQVEVLWRGVANFVAPDLGILLAKVLRIQDRS
jgi:hypothetical protein